MRVGNAAYPQLQLDSYGELMDFIYLYNKYGEPISCQLWENLQWLVGWIVEHWRLPDEGIWEVRGGRQEFLHSRLMCWVAVDRAIRLAERRSFPYPIDKWRATRDEIYRDTMRTFWDPTRNLRPAPRDARGRRLEPPDADGRIYQSDRSARENARLRQQATDDSLILGSLPRCPSCSSARTRRSRHQGPA